MTQNVVENYSASQVIQVQYKNGAGLASSNTTPVDITNSNVTITPVSATSRILIMASFYFQDNSLTLSVEESFIQCVRNAAVIGGTPYSGFLVNSGTAPVWRATASFTIIDTPATTSLITYKFQQYLTVLSGSAGLTTTSNGTVIVMELKP